MKCNDVMYCCVMLYYKLSSSYMNETLNAFTKKYLLYEILVP